MHRCRKYIVIAIAFIPICIICTVIALVNYGMEAPVMALKSTWGFIVERSWESFVGVILVWFLAAGRTKVFHKSWWKKFFKEERLKEFLNTLWAPVVAFGLIYLCFILFIIPGRMYSKEKEGRNDAEAEAARLKQQLAAETAANSERRQVASVSALTNLWNMTAAQIDESVRRNERIAAEGGKAGEEFLKEIAARPVHIPKIEGGHSIDLSSINSVAKALDDRHSKKAAEEALVKGNNVTNDAIALSVGSEIADYYIGVFVDALNRLAAIVGDRVLSTYAGAVRLAKKPVDSDWAEIKLEKHPNWLFKVYFRNQGAPGNFNWEIYGGASYFTAAIRGDTITYQLVGTQYSGSAKLADIGPTNLVPLLTWMIGMEQSAQPLR